MPPPVTLVAPALAPAAPVALSPAVASPIRVLVGGDLIPHRPSLLAPESIRAALTPLRPLFVGADATVVNFEAAVGRVDEKTHRMAYGASPSWLAELPALGIRALTLSNNHACDLGETGLGASIATADAQGLIALGADDDEPWAPRVIAERDGKRICAVAWTTQMNARGSCAREPRLAIATADARGKRRITRAVERATAECDATVAIMHGGEEYVAQTSEMIDLAARAAESGADAVVIHHPHVPSPVVVRTTHDGRRVPIFASVGNLVSNQGESWRDGMFPVLRENRRMVCVNAWTRLGVLADLAFDLRGEAPTLTWGFHLAWTENSHAEDRAAPARIATRLVDPATDQRLLGRLARDHEGPVALLSDACWVEGLDRDAGATRARCRTPVRGQVRALDADVVRAAPDAAPQLARRRVRPAAKAHPRRPSRP